METNDPQEPDIIEAQVAPVSQSTTIIKSETLATMPASEPQGAIMSPEETKTQVQHIQQILRLVMIEDTHYGRVPGCGDKPCLLKPGAEKLGLVFRLGSRLNVTRLDFPDFHREFTIVCELFHIPTGNFVGQGIGSCSTMESKYRYRSGGLKCPNCGEATIKESKYGAGGYYCFAKIGGCNEKFKRGNPAIESQEPSGRVENPDIADTYNTVLKMAKKRAQVDAILSATAASDIFTQDLDDDPQGAANDAPPPRDNGRANRKTPGRAPHTTKQRDQNKQRPKFSPRGTNVKTVVKDIKSKEITSGPNRGLVRWGIFISQGFWLNTQNETLADVAEEGKNGAIVTYHYDTESKCHILDDITAEPDIPPAQVDRSKPDLKEEDIPY